MKTSDQSGHRIPLLLQAADSYIEALDSSILNFKLPNDVLESRKQLKLQVVKTVHELKLLSGKPNSFEQTLKLEIGLQWLINQCQYHLEKEEQEHLLGESSTHLTDTSFAQYSPLTAGETIGTWLIFQMAFRCGRFFGVKYYNGCVKLQEFFRLFIFFFLSSYIELKFTLRYWKYKFEFIWILRRSIQKALEKLVRSN
jgi:hypothetical protein